MAIRFFAVVVLLYVVFMCFVMEETMAFGDGIDPSQDMVAQPEFVSRKMLVMSGIVFKSFRPLDTRDGGRNMVDSDLRKVPSGPDPLHHNRSPQKPQTP